MLQEIRNDMELIKNDRQLKMVIPPDVEEKIRLACASVPTLEWSGALFYDYKGSFENGSLTVICRDLLLMDIGTGTYTEWTEDADIISFMAENDLLDCQVGIIHSHQSFNCFFSGTDLNTLLQEGQSKNNIVSLIVNNKGEYQAALTRKVDSISKVKETGCYNFFGEGAKKFTDSYETNDSYVEYFLMDIDRQEPNSLFSFIDRLDEIKGKKGVDTHNRTSSKPNYTFNMDEYDDGLGYGSDLFSHPSTSATLVSPMSGSLGDVTGNSFFQQENDKLISDIAAQLVTGNIFEYETCNLDYYITNHMEKEYSKRFGEIDESNKVFASWIDSMLNFLLYNSGNPGKDSHSEMDNGSRIAEALVCKLQPFEHNKCLKTIINIVKDYI